LYHQIGRGVKENPLFAIGGHGGGRLGLMTESGFIPAGGAAILAVAIPLRNATTRRGAKNADVHNLRKEAGTPIRRKPLRRRQTYLPVFT